MPIFIPDRLKTPGEFPSIDANDNQIRGFGFFADNNARTALSEDFRCQGYLAFMKDTVQFKQYNAASVDYDSWRNDSNWDLLEGTTTDTYWAVDIDGTGIYYNNQVIVGGSTYGGDEKLYVNGDAKISGYLVASEIQSESGIDFKIDTNASGGASEDFAVKYNNGSDTYRDAFIAKPFAATPNIAFGNIFDDFKLDHYSSSFSEFRALSASINETGFKFTDFGGQDGVMLFRMRTDESYLELSDGDRKISTSPHTYKIFSTVEADATVTHSVEMLMPDSATGDWTFNHLGNKNYVFNTNTDSSSKLITKFHAQGNGVVSIGTANYYNEYNGIQYPTYSSNIQPRLFIVNDQGSSTGIRVQSGDTTLGAEGARTQPRFFTDMRDDGFYISRTTTGPVYDETAAEGEEWDGSGGGTPSASSGISRGDGFGNQMNIFARSGIDFKVNNEDVFGVLGGGNASVSDNHGFYLSNHSESATTATMSVYARPNGTFDFSSSIIGKFLQVFSSNAVGFGAQGIQVYGRGIDSRSKSFGNPESNTTPPLRVYSLLGNSDNTGYWWGADGESYDTQAELLAAGTTVDTEKLADQVAIYVPKHGSGKVGIGTTSPQGKLHVAGIGLFDDSVNIYRSNNSWSRTMLMFSRLDENSVKKNVGHIGTAVNSTITAEKGYRFYFSNQARGANNYAKQHLAILENGDVEIKNTSSESSSNLEGDARLKVVGGTSDDTKNALSVNASDNSSLLLVRNDGNVGIGTTNPTAKLYVDGDARVNGTFYTLNGLQNFANRADMSFLNATNNTGYLRFITQRDGSQNESLRITNVGNVGVGTTAPSSKLHVYGNVTGDEGNQGKLRVYGSPPAAEDSEETIYGSTTWSPGGSIEIGRIVNGSAVTPGLTLNGHSSSAGSSSGTAARANIYKHGSILDVGFSGGSGSRIAPVFNEVYSLGSTGRKWLELHYTSSYSSWVVSGLQSSSNLAAITYANRRGHDKFYPTAVDIGSRTTSIVANGGITINPKFVYRDAYTNVSDNPASATSGGLGRGIASDVTSINGVGFDDQTTDLNDTSNYNTGVYVSNPTYYILSYSGGDFTTDSDDGAVDYLRVEVSSNGSIRGIQPCDSSGNWKSSSIGSGFRIGDKISFPAGFAGAGSESIEVALKPFTGLQHDSFSSSDPGLSIADGGPYTHKIKAGGIRGVTGLYATYEAGITVDDMLDDLQGFNGGLSLSVEEDGQVSVLPVQSFMVKARDMVLTGPRISDGVNETQWLIGRSGLSPSGSDRKSIGLDSRAGVRWFRYGADSGSKYIITSSNPITGSVWSSSYTFSDSDLPDPVNDTSVITYGANTYKIQNPHGNISSTAGAGSNGGVHGFQLSVGIGGFIDTYTDGNGVVRTATRKVQVVPLIKGWGGNAEGQSTPDGDGYASVVIGKDDEFIFDDHGDIICTIPEKGIVLTAPNGEKYRILVGNGGVIFSEAYTPPSAYTD
jgi:hypothetical protein